MMNDRNGGQLGDTWYLGQVFMKIKGVLHYHWRTVVQVVDKIDI
jgi:putative transposase